MICFVDCHHLFISVPPISFHSVSAYYSNARFVMMALHKLLDGIKDNELEMPFVSFSYHSANESISLHQIYHNLVHSMNVVFRFLTDRLPQSEADEDPAFPIAFELFSNSHRLPDGSAVYGIVLNSHSVAVDGFGDSENGGHRHGDGAVLSNIEVTDLKLSVAEVIAMYFDECDHGDAHSIQKGPFGDVLDITKMVHPLFGPLIEEYESSRSVLNRNIKGFQYLGNPLSDAQIALNLWGQYLESQSNQNGVQCSLRSGGAPHCTFGYGSYLSPHFLEWAVRDIGDSSDWPECGQFVCNGVCTLAPSSSTYKYFVDSFVPNSD